MSYNLNYQKKYLTDRADSSTLQTQPTLQNIPSRTNRSTHAASKHRLEVIATLQENAKIPSTPEHVAVVATLTPVAAPAAHTSVAAPATAPADATPTPVVAATFATPVAVVAHTSVTTEPAAHTPATTPTPNVGIKHGAIEDQAYGTVEEQAAEQAAQPTKLSPTGASIFEQCPKRWRFCYIDKLPDEPTLAAQIGTFTHRVLEELMHEKPQQRTLDQTRKLARNVWENFQTSENYLALELNDKQAWQFRWEAWAAIEGLWDIEDPRSVHVEAIEAKLAVMLGSVPFRGVVDRIDLENDQLIVTDYKSGKKPPSRLENERLHQVLLYSAAVEADTGRTPAQARLYYLGQKVVDTEVTEEKIAHSVDRLTNTWNQIIQACSINTFEAQPSKLCGYCPYLESCVEGQSYVTKKAAEKAAETAALIQFADRVALRSAQAAAYRQTRVRRKKQY